MRNSSKKCSTTIYSLQREKSLKRKVIQLDNVFFMLCFYAGMDGGTFLTQHLIGVKDAVKGVTLFWLFNEFIGGLQLTCSILAAYIATIPDAHKKTIFIQMDNCAGENKNWLVLQFCSMLVGMGKVLSIQLSFLPVGHTHIDIDQVTFSVICIFT